MTLAQSKRASDLQTDINAWEENRLFRSGVVRLKEVLTPVSCAWALTACLTQLGPALPWPCTLTQSCACLGACWPA